MSTLAYVPQRNAAKAAEDRLRRNPTQKKAGSRVDSPSSSAPSASSSTPSPGRASVSSAASSTTQTQSRKPVFKTYKSRPRAAVPDPEPSQDLDSTLSDLSDSEDEVNVATQSSTTAPSSTHVAQSDNHQPRQPKTAPTSTPARSEDDAAIKTPAEASSSPLRATSKRSAAQAAQNSIQRAYSDSVFAELAAPAQKKSRSATSPRSPASSRVKADHDDENGDLYRAPSAKGKSKASFKSAASTQTPKERRRLQDEQGQLWELQFETCQVKRYRHWRRCVQCIAKKIGDTCRFIGFRAFLVDPATNDIYAGEAADAVEPALISSPDPDEVMHLPSSRPLASDALLGAHADVARALLPVLEAELEHAKQDNTLRRPRETTCRQMCEFCSTSIFSASWFCERCGREYCLDCKHAIEQHDESDLTILKRITQCDRVRGHKVDDLIPLTRFDISLLEQETVAMRAMMTANKAKVRSDDEPSLPSGSLTTVDASNGSEAEDAAAIFWKEVPTNRAGLTADHAIGSHTLRTFDASNFNTERFCKEWAHGEPLLVRDVTGPMKHTWDPDSLASRYGEESCHILRSDTDLPEIKEVSVGDFFSTFGQDLEQKEQVLGQGSWKLKDWPPSAEFKHEFPELYEDFNLAVPAPEYTTREGVLNLGSCYPIGVIQPDLGPKMYNAWPASEGPRGQGTTRLHMDIADAVNIMLYAAPPVGDDIPEEHRPGVAAWDIFRASDADALRAFLREEHAKLKFQDDPIHIQRFFISAPQRVKLWRKYGVKSWRIYQKPGEAVFIPAGCAHQVCNLTDCVKVAVDFVSPQNVGRCFKLTAEFRELVKDHKKGWKEDVLSLRTTLWYAWCTYREMDGGGPNVWAKEQATIKGEGIARVTKKVLQRA
ncbi:JmjC [Kalmanozyma brasiliensis GHG001]|uniref:JmjC n=1 Tax=Kalmanozyma brasiliensis (strain GHG001) TaxID=1365824 RepID=UPI002868258D|nr:JmjC [Kalmanozyma brasiliensis GHG001]KAF6767664.1 JmjC [Kalmanozyma brasiliensis GHG001]